MVRSRGLEPPRVAPLAPQASASTNSATTADGRARAGCPRIEATALDVTNRPQRNKGGGAALHPPGLGLAGILVRILPPRAGLDSAPPRDVAGAERLEQKPRWSVRAILRWYEPIHLRARSHGGSAKDLWHTRPQSPRWMRARRRSPTA